MDDTELGEETKRKIAMEKVCDLSISYLYFYVYCCLKLSHLGVTLILILKARQDHLKSMQEQSASKLRSENVRTSFGAPLEVSLMNAGDGHIVNLAREEDEEPVRIPSSMSSKLKPHQVCVVKICSLAYSSP
jgi:transcriptional regulator ATRX